MPELQIPWKGLDQPSVASRTLYKELFEMGPHADVAKTFQRPQAPPITADWVWQHHNHNITQCTNKTSIMRRLEWSMYAERPNKNGRH